MPRDWRDFLYFLILQITSWPAVRSGPARARRCETGAFYLSLNSARHRFVVQQFANANVAVEMCVAISAGSEVAIVTALCPVVARDGVLSKQVRSLV